MKKLFLILFLPLITFSAYAQNPQAEYLEAKRLYNTRQYRAASQSFSTLTDHEVFGPYAGYYYGMCALKQKDTTVALDMFRQLLFQYPKWQQRSEVLFWLSYIQFEKGDYDKGLEYAEELTDFTVNSGVQTQLIKKYLPGLEIEKLKSLYENNQENREIASILAGKLNALPYGERNELYLQELIDKWNFELEDIEIIDLPLIRKDKYDIGIFLPFLYESLSNTTVITQNRLIMDMYQGMQLAAEDLRASGYPVDLWPYDTKKDAEVTGRLLKQEEVLALDLIVGPLYPGPNQVVNEFSKENYINTINPISSNGQVIGDNPLSFLIKPSYATIALEMARLAIQENDSNRNVMIIYEDNPRDSAFAAIYKQKMDSSGFNVVWYQAVDNENSKELLDALSRQYDNYLTQEEADSIILLPGRFVRNRRIRANEMDKMDKKGLISYDDDANEIVYYEKKFKIALDSIGHILGATHSNLYANNLISAVETRNDSIKLYGYGDWLDFTMLSYNQLDRLCVALSHPDYIDKDEYFYQNLERRLQDKYNTLPSMNHYRGYELIWYVGNMMHRYGKYFQRGVKGGGFYKGRVFEGFRYETGNDNQVVPVVRFRDAVLEVVNKESYENREK